MLDRIEALEYIEAYLLTKKGQKPFTLGKALQEISLLYSIPMTVIEDKYYGEDTLRLKGIESANTTNNAIVQGALFTLAYSAQNEKKMIKNKGFNDRFGKEKELREIRISCGLYRQGRKLQVSNRACYLWEKLYAKLERTV